MAESDQKVFVDSNFFIALNNPADSLHKQALEISKNISADNPRLLISNLIFLEVVTVISQQVSRKASINLGASLLEASHLEIVHIDQWLNRRTWQIFKEIRKKNISYVDCSALAVMRSEEIKFLLTFDRKDFANLRKRYRFNFYA